LDTLGLTLQPAKTRSSQVDSTNTVGLITLKSGDRSRRNSDDLIVRHAATVRRIEQLPDANGRNRRAEQIALRFRYCPVGADQFELLVGLDSLDHDRHSKIGRQPRYAAQQRQRTVAIDPFQEGAVDLHLLQWEVVKIAESGIT